MVSNMARKQVLVQLDDELIEQLDELAAMRGVSRSELLRQGARAVVAAADALKADRKLRAAYQRRPQDTRWVEAATRLAAENAVEW
jgi:metal-responsive CopG/Arc/MetJ family transcriptional regulator